MFPFVDIFPWLQIYRTKEAALRQIQLYMNTVQPVVTVTFSRPTTSIVFANFVHHRGMISQKNDTFLEYVGIPKVCYMLDEDWIQKGTKSKNPSMSNATIVVPHIHPGKERYGARSVTLNAILDLTWTITLIICEVAIRKAQTGRYNERKALLDEIWPLVDASSARVVERLAKAYKKLEDSKKRAIGVQTRALETTTEKSYRHSK